MSVFEVQPVILDGVVPVKNQVTAPPDSFANSGRTFILMENLDTEGRSVIIDSQTPCDQAEGDPDEGDHDITVVVGPDDDWRMIGPFPKSRFNDADGMVHLSYTGDIAAIKIALLEVP